MILVRRIPVFTKKDSAETISFPHKGIVRPAPHHFHTVEKCKNSSRTVFTLS